MTMSIYSLTNYGSAFTSPVPSYQLGPVANFIYGAEIGKIYSQTVAKSAQHSMSSYLSSLSSRINNLKFDARTLANTGSVSSFNKKAVFSTDNTEVKGTAANNAGNNTYTLNISKLAQAQTNNGNKLDSNSESAFSRGLNSFNLKIGNTNKTVTFNITDNDTNKSSLEKMSNAINSSKLGVTASVKSDSKTGLSYLSIASDKTGTDNSFSITDKTGNAVSASGADTSTVKAQDAEYSVDGRKFTSHENTALLDNGKVQVDFTKASGKDVALAVGTDITSIANDIAKFADDYNKVINLSHTYSDTFDGTSRLKLEFGSSLASSKVSLENAGIHINSDDTLTVDRTKLEKSLKNNLSAVKDIFAGHSGIAQKVTAKSQEVISAPLKYTYPNDTESSANNYSSYLKLIQKSPTVSNAYPGMVVNMLL